MVYRSLSIKGWWVLTGCLRILQAAAQTHSQKRTYHRVFGRNHISLAHTEIRSRILEHVCAATEEDLGESSTTECCEKFRKSWRTSRTCHRRVMAVDWLKVVTSMSAASQLRAVCNNSRVRDGGATMRRISTARKCLMVVPDVMNGESPTGNFFFLSYFYRSLSATCTHILQYTNTRTPTSKTGTTNLFIRNSLPSGRQSTVVRRWNVLTWDFLRQLVLICIRIFIIRFSTQLSFSFWPQYVTTYLVYSSLSAVRLAAIVTAASLRLQTFFWWSFCAKVILYDLNSERLARLSGAALCVAVRMNLARTLVRFEEMAISISFLSSSVAKHNELHLEKFWVSCEAL